MKTGTKVLIIMCFLISFSGLTAMETFGLELLERWNSALSTEDPEAVVRLYSEKAVLVPTVSNVIRTDRGEIIDYFKHFLQKNPKALINNISIEKFGDLIISSGIYTFYLQEEKSTEEVMARFTFVYKNIDGNWLIVHHHSSLLPENY